MESISLADWALRRGVSRATATRWFHSGRLPCRAEQAAGGRREIRVYPDQPAEECTCADDFHATCVVDKLRAAGYVVLTREQADVLGVT